MKKLLLLCFLIPTLNAETIASCGALKGQSYHPYYGTLANKKMSGWSDNGIENGKTTVTFNNGNLDILFIDVLNEIRSAKDQGSEIEFLMLSDNSFTISSTVLNRTIEIYTFWKNIDGEYKFSLSSTKGGFSLIPSNNLFVGDCSFISMSWMEELLSED